jgi:hypothetical protein
MGMDFRRLRNRGQHILQQITQLLVLMVKGRDRLPPVMKKKREKKGGERREKRSIKSTPEPKRSGEKEVTRLELSMASSISRSKITSPC